jgi:FkbM family methyltransferase
MDVGAEQGAFAAGMLDAGVEQLHAFEPHPENVEALRARLSGDERVAIHDYAVSDNDGTGDLYISTRPDGGPLPFGHTLSRAVDTAEIVWSQSISVTLRSLQSLIDAGEVPERVGILKIDTEGHDLAVIQGMGRLKADVVMVEHWMDLPGGLGVCPWTTLEMVQALRPRGFSHFAFVVHRGEFTTLKWDDGDVERGAMGNLVFLHDSVLARLLPDVLELAGWLGEQAVAAAQRYTHVATDRLAIIEGLERAADERLAVVRDLKHAAEARLKALEAAAVRLDIQAAELEALRQRVP